MSGDDDGLVAGTCAAHLLVHWRGDDDAREVARHALACAWPPTVAAADDECTADVTCECWSVAPPGSARLPKALWRPSASSSAWLVRDGPLAHAVLSSAGDAPVMEAPAAAVAALLRQYGYEPWVSVRFAGVALVRPDGAAAARVLAPRVDVRGGVAAAQQLGDAGRVARVRVIDVRAPLPADALAGAARRCLPDAAVVVGGRATGWRTDERDARSVVLAGAAIARKFALLAEAVLRDDGARW